MKTDRHLHYERTLLTFLLLFFFGASVSAAGTEDSNGTIRGSVTTSDGKPAVSVTVHLRGTLRSTLTNEEGRFTLHRIPAGGYTIEVSLVGYETRRLNVGAYFHFRQRGGAARSPANAVRAYLYGAGNRSRIQGHLCAPGWKGDKW